MNFLKLLGSLLVHLLKAITYRWILDLIDILKRFFAGIDASGGLRFRIAEGTVIVQEPGVLLS